MEEPVDVHHRKNALVDNAAKSHVELLLGGGRVRWDRHLEGAGTSKTQRTSGRAGLDLVYINYRQAFMNQV